MLLYDTVSYFLDFFEILSVVDIAIEKLRRFILAKVFEVLSEDVHKVNCVSLFLREDLGACEELLIA